MQIPCQQCWKQHFFLFFGKNQTWENNILWKKEGRSPESTEQLKSGQAGYSLSVLAPVSCKAADKKKSAYHVTTPYIHLLCEKFQQYSCTGNEVVVFLFFPPKSVSIFRTKKSKNKN